MLSPSPPDKRGKEPWFSALGSRDFRYYWIGSIISISGLQMLWMVQGWLIYELTGSKLLLGFIGLAGALPSIPLTLLGGMVADKVDQRRLLIAVELLRVTILAVLATLCFIQVVQVWHIFAAAFANSAIGAFAGPARMAMFPHLIQRSALTNAVALNAAVHPGTRIFGPAVGGIILAQVFDATSSAMIAAATLYSLTALGHSLNATFLYRVHLPPVQRSRKGTVLQGIWAGLEFMGRNRIFAFLTGMAFCSMVFATASSALYPVFSKDILHAGPSGLGFLYMAMGIGSFSGAIIGGRLSNPQRRSPAIIVGMAVQGIFLFLFAVSSWYPGALLFLALMGIGASVFDVAAQTTLQLLVPDEFRGRVMGVYGMRFHIARPIGELQVGSIAALISAPFAVALGGGLVLAIALLVAAPSRLMRQLNMTLAGAEVAEVNHGRQANV